MKSYMGFSVAPEYRTVSNRPLFDLIGLLPLRLRTGMRIENVY